MRKDLECEGIEMIGMLTEIIFILIILIGLIVAVMHLSPNDYHRDEEEK
jgi:hypothetical protein